MLLPLGARGGEGPGALPADPPVARATAFARWQMVSSERSAKITVTKTGAVYCREAVLENGAGLLQWWKDGALFTRNPNDPGFLVSYGGIADDLYLNYAAMDFPELAWVRPGGYAGTQRVNDVECLVFKGVAGPEILNELRSALAQPSMAKGAALEVWLDARTRLPVLLGIAHSKYSYTFLQPPTAPLVLPEAMARQAAAWESRKAELLAPAPRP